MLARIRIISGGQTGVDRAALDWALMTGLPHGGWCPRGRIAEDGVIDARYQLLESESSGYRQRTKRNVVEADATLIVNIGDLEGGTAATLRLAEQQRKPVLMAQLDDGDLSVVVRRIEAWLGLHKPTVLNIAGPREGKRPGIYLSTLELLMSLSR